MLGIKIVITRWVSDDQPGFVECQLEDVHGRRWLFVEKTAVVVSEYPDARSAYTPERG